MISENLQILRKLNKLTQEEVAEKVGVSRQAVAKWENGDSIPDINNCVLLSKIYDVTVDNLVNYEESAGVSIPPKGKYMFGTVKVGERGQMVIPKEARELFDINPGDNLIILGDEERGLAIVKADSIMDFLYNATKMQDK